MNKNYFSEIINQFFKSRHSKKTEEKIQQWIIDEENQDKKEKEIFNFWQSLDMETDDNVYESWNKMNDKRNSKPSKRIIKAFRLPKVAAILIPLLLIGGLTFYLTKSHVSNITLTVPYGEQKKIVLPDESVIWLNSGSTLVYPEKFNNATRTVQLCGEAYFAVIKDNSKDFIVETGELNIRVIGTEFNVNAYPDNPSILTYVKKGKVEIVINNETKKIISTSQLLTYNKSVSSYEIIQVSEEKISGWKNGDLFFEKQTLPEIFKILERKFDIRFETVKTLSDDDRIYTISFSNQENINNIMDILGEMARFSYSIDHHKIQVLMETDR